MMTRVLAGTKVALISLSARCHRGTCLLSGWMRCCGLPAATDRRAKPVSRRWKEPLSPVRGPPRKRRAFVYRCRFARRCALAATCDEERPRADRVEEAILGDGAMTKTTVTDFYFEPWSFVPNNGCLR